MSGRKENPGFLRSIIQQTIQKRENKGLSKGAIGVTYMTPGEATSQQLTQGMSAENVKKAVYSSEERHIDSAIKRQMQEEIAAYQQQEVLKAKKDIDQGTAREKELKAKIDAERGKLTAFRMNPTNQGTGLGASLLNPEAQLLYDEMQKNVEGNLSPIIAEYEAAKKANQTKALEFTKTQEYLKANKRIKELEEKTTAFNTKNIASAAIAASSGDPLLGQLKMYAASTIGSALQHISKSISPTEDNLSPTERKEYLMLKKSVRSINTPLVQDFVDRQKSFLEESRTEARKNRDSMSISDKFLDHFSDLELERAIEGGEDFLQEKGGADIFFRELGRITANTETGVFEDMQRNLVGDFVMKDNLFDKEKEVGFDNLSPTEQLAFRKYEAAQHLNNEMADKHDYGYRTVKGTMGSLAFVRDMVLPSKFMSVGGKLFGLERAAVATNAALKAEALAGKTIGTATEMGIKGGAFAMETAATTYLNPRNINENKDPMGLELVRDSKGNVVDALTREDLYEAKKKSLEKERIRMTDAKRKLEAKSNLSQEEQNLLKTVKARLGEEEVEGMISIDDQLSNYEVSSDFAAHAKGIASTAVEKVSELYTGKLLGGAGKLVTKYVPGANKIASLSAKASDYIGGKFYSTGVGKAYKNWNNLVGKLTVGNNKVIGSVFEEIPEEYVAAVGNSILDWDTRELEQTFSTQGTLDIVGQTVLMNSMMGAGQLTGTSSKLLYNKLYNNKIQTLDKKIEEFKKITEANPEDKDTANAIKNLEKEKATLQGRSTLTGLGITSRITRDKTGFSSTKNYIDNRKQVRQTVEQLRGASTDEAVNTALDVSTLSVLTAAQKDEEARTLRAQGKNKEAELIEKSMFRDIISKAFDTNTQDELKHGLDKAMRASGVSAEKLEQLSQAKETLEQLIEVQEKYKDNSNVRKAVQLTYENLSAKAEVKNVERELASLQTPVREKIEALARVKGLGSVDFSLDTLLDRTFEDPKEQEKYDNLLQEIETFGDDQVQSYLNGLDLKNDLEQHAAEALIAKNELLNPTLESRNADKFLKEVSKAGKNLLDNKTNTLNLEGVEYDVDGNIIQSEELVTKLYDKLGETWIGEASQGKISRPAFEKLKRKAVAEHNKYTQFVEGARKLQEAIAAAELENQKAEETIDVEDVDTTDMQIDNVALAQESQDLANAAFDDFYNLINTPISDTLTVSEDDLLDAFGDEMIFSPEVYSQVQLDLMKEKVAQIGSHINSITGQDVSLTQLVDFYFRSVSNKAAAINTIKYLVKGWEISKNSDGSPFNIESGEVTAIWNKYFPLMTSDIAEEVLNQFAESLPDIHVDTLKATPGILEQAVEAKNIAQEVEVKNAVTENIPLSDIESLEAETFAVTNTEVESLPKVGFNTMPYEVVNVNGVVKKRTKGSLLKDFSTDPMGVDPRPLLNPDNGPTMVLGIEKSSEQDWDKIPVSNGFNENSEVVTIPFSQWVEENKSKSNFKELFSDKVPYFYTYEGKRVGYVHDTDWYNEFSVPNPLKNSSSYSDSIAWQQEVEAGKRAERKLRKAIEAGLTSVEAMKPTTVKYHTINPIDEPLLTLRQSNPQGIIAVQKGTENLIDSLPQDLKLDFAQGRKRLINTTDTSSKGAVSKDTNGHTWYLHRVGTEINSVTKEKVETYQAVKTQGYVDNATFNSLQWAVIAHKVLNNVNVPTRFNQGLNQEQFKKYIVDNFSTPIYKAMGLNIQNPADLGKYIQHFAKISPRGLAVLNAAKMKNTPTWKNIDNSTSALAYQYFLLEQNYTLADLTAKDQEILLRSSSVAGVVSNKKVLLLNQEGAYEHKTPEGNVGTYQDYLKDTVKSEVKAFDMSTNSTPNYALGVQPIIYIDYSMPSEVKNLEEKESRIQAAEEAKIEIALEAPAEEFNVEAATEYLDTLGINVEDFMEDQDYLIGDIDKIKDLFNLTPGLSTLDEVTIKEQIAHSIISKLDFKSKVSPQTKEKIKQEIKRELEAQFKTILDTLNTMASKVSSTSEDPKVKATALALENTINTINSVLTNMDDLYSKALQEVNKQAKVDLEEEVELEDDATLMEKNYSKESVEESLKTKASSRLRMLFSGIPQVDAKGNIVKGFLGFPRRMSLNDVYNQVLRNIAIDRDSASDFDSLIKRLETSNSIAMKEVVKRLKESDSQIQNEFVYNVVAHTLSSKFAMFEKQRNGFSLKMYDTNSNEITRVLKNIWKDNSISSELYHYDGSINVPFANSLIEEFENLPADLNLVDPADLRNWLSKVGMEMSDETWNQIYSVDQGLFSGSRFISFKDLYSVKQGGLFFPLVQFLRDAVANVETYFVDSNKSIFDDLSGISTAIVKIEARYNPQLLSLSFRDGDKSIFTQTPPKYATDKVTELVNSAKGNKEYLDKLRTLSFTQDSLILDLLSDNKNFRDLFKVHHTAINSLKEKGVKSFGKSDITSLSDMDYDLVTTTGFSDRRIEKLVNEAGEAVNIDGFKLRLANMLFPTMSDKSTGLFLTTPIFDFLDTPEGFSFTKEGDKITGITQDVKEILFKSLVLPEIKRIHKFYSEVKSTNIKGYDKGAGMFHLLPIMNTLTMPNSDTTVVDYLKNNAEIVSLDTFLELSGDILKNAIEGVVNKEVDLKLKEWESVKEKGASPMFSSEYFTTIGKNPVKDYEAAVYDYVMNSMISNAEMFKVFAGDVALYSQDKVFKKDFNKNPEEYINASKQIGVNLGKRLALLVAPGKKIAGSYTESEREYNQIFLKDSVDISENASFLIEMYYGKAEAKQAKKLLDRYSKATKALNYFKQLEVKENTVLRQKENIEKYQQLVDKYRNELKDTYKSIGDYFDIESTDAQEYTTITEHVNILSKMGRISATDENSILNKLAGNQDLTKEELSLVMQPIKPVYTGSHINETLDVNQIVYIKSSSFPLIPQLTAGTELDNLRKTMEKLESVTGRFTRASYQTANKVGSVLDRNTIDPLNKTELDKVFEGLNPVTGKYDTSSRSNSVMILDRNNFRIQQDVPFKSDKKKKDEVSLGTQIFKLLFGDGIIDEVFDTKEDGTPITGQDLYNTYNESFTSLVNIKKEELFDELGLSSKGKVENEKDFYTNLQNVLIKEATDRGYSLKSIRGLSMESLVVAATGIEYREFKTPLWLSPDSNRYESLLNSIITNRVMKHKMPGNGYVAGSESGFKFQEEAKGLDKSRVIFLDGWNGEELQGASIKQEDGSYTFTKAQVFAPSKFKNKDGKLIDLFEDFNGTEGKYIVKTEGKLSIKEGMIDKETLNLFSFRTPTSSHVSASSIEVVGILPPESGDLMIVPKNFTKQKGLDYDIDKESAYQLNSYVNEAGQIKVLDKEAVVEETKKLREKLERIHLDLLSAQRKGFPIANMFEETMSLMSNQFNKEELEKIFKPEVSLAQKLKVLDRNLNRKLAENEFIRTSLAVYNSTNVNVQKRINKVLSMDFAKNQAEEIERMNEEGDKQAFIKEYRSKNPQATFGDALNAYTEDLKNFSILNYSYQKDKMKLGSVGKSAIGVYALYTTYNGLIQTKFGSKGMAITKEGDTKKFTLGKFISTRLGAVNTLDGGRTTSEVFAEKENTATDNEKEQILGRVGVNELTINVDSLLTLRGFDKTVVNGKEYSIPYLLLSQPSIKGYVKTLKESKGMFGEFVTKEEIIKSTVLDLSDGKISYDLDIETGMYSFREVDNFVSFDFNGSKKLTGENMIKGIKENGKDKDIQLDAFMSFVELDIEARQVAAAQKITNVNSLGKSMVETSSKNESLAALADSKLLPSAIRLLGDVSTEPREGYLPFQYEIETSKGPVTITNYIKPTTPQGQIVVNGLYYGNELFKEFFPYREKSIKTVLREIGLPENESARIDKIESIFEEIKKYFYSNPNLGVYAGDTSLKRQELFVDDATNTSLSTYLKQTLKSKDAKYSKGLKALNNNPLLKRLLFDSGKSNNKFSLIKYNNAANDNLDEESLYNSLPELIMQDLPLPDRNGKPYSTTQLAEDLTAYSFLEGGVQEATQFIKFVPVELLEAMGKLDKKGNFLSISKVLRMLNSKVNANRDIFSSSLGIKSEAFGGPSDFTTQYFQHYPKEATRIKLEERGELRNNETEFTIKNAISVSSFVYVQLKDKSLKLYKHTGSGNYVEIDILKGAGASQYQFKNSQATNLKQKSLTEAPIDVVQKDADTPVAGPTADTTIQGLMEQISKFDLADNHKHLSELAKWLAPMTKQDSKLTIREVKEGFKGSTGSETLNITLNKDIFNSQEELATTMVHEFIHHVTTKELAQYYDPNFNSLLEDATVPQYVKTLDTVFSTFKDTVSSMEGYEDFSNLLATYKNRALSLEDRQKARLAMSVSENKELFYAASNIKEFIAIALTDSEFQKRLSEMPYKDTDKSILDKIMELIAEIFSAVYPTIKQDTLAFDALKASMNFIEIEYNKRENNSLPLPNKDIDESFYKAQEDSLMYQAPNTQEDMAADDSGMVPPDIPEEPREEEDELPFLKSVGISIREWEALSLQEQQKIKECN